MADPVGWKPSAASFAGVLIRCQWMEKEFGGQFSKACLLYLAPLSINVAKPNPGRSFSRSEGDIRRQESPIAWNKPQGGGYLRRKMIGEGMAKVRID
ncbi:MAG: hypothetical protein KGQ60_05920 [Planctomycetes bacterium]|nr:hypothetical protein [Planctomycetota bacterium]